MTKIFVSYRRDDSADISGRIYDRLTAQFGRDAVFKDVDSIPFGVNFKTYLNEMVNQCAVLLAVIGKQWLTIADEHGNRRLDNPRDFVRIEIEAALNRNIPVIPVLVQGAAMPDESALPASMVELVYRNGTVVRRDPDFHTDMNRLIKALDGWLKAAPPAPKGPTLLDLMPPPFAWIQIPAGKVTLVTEQGWAKNYIAEGKSQTFDVLKFTIAKYPVTNAQFALFLEVGGYGERRWWTGDGWVEKEKEGWTEPRYWQDAKWNQPDNPVVGVSWYESLAFCLWLREITGEKIMLPTEEQWQRAAQGDKNLIYPWGNEWDGSRCNNSVRPNNSNSTTSVSYYQRKGESLFGVVDMAGNVQEWCRTDYEDGSKNINKYTKNPVSRGGSWINYSPDSFRVAHRSGDFPSWGNDLIGFRLAVS